MRKTEHIKILLKDVSFSYVEQDGSSLSVLSKINLEVRNTGIYSVLGPSGCGKTTLLNLVAGLLSEQQGKAEVTGARKIGYVFQDARLLPWRSLRSNVALPLELLGRIDEDKVTNQLKMFGLLKYENYMPDQLSGGMKTRVNLARALSTNPKLLLMDEPFSSIDPMLRYEFYEEIRRYILEQEIVCIVVTHDVDEAILFSDVISVLGGEPTKILDTMIVPLPSDRRFGDLYESPIIDFAKTIRHKLGLSV